MLIYNRNLDLMKKGKSIERKAIPAYQDTSLTDRPDEKWESMPELEPYFMVSNFGRIKRLARKEIHRNGSGYIRPERIIKIQLGRAFNTVKKDYTYQLVINPMIDNHIHHFSIKRLVYYCFVNGFDLNDHYLNVIPKNGNGLDMRPENLALVDIKKKIRRVISKGRMVNKFEYVDRYKAVKNSKKKTSKKVYQYDMNGTFVKSYKSMHEADRQTGIANNSICASANGRQLTAGGFYWRHNKVKQIDIDAILSTRQEHRREARGTKVTQYDLEGKPIAWFNSLADAAEAAHCYYTNISATIRGKVKTGGGFQWRRGHNKKRIKAIG